MFAAPGAKKSIRDEFRSKGFNVTSASLGEVCFEIMRAFLKKFKDGEKFIYPAVVADSQNTVTRLQLFRDVNFKCPLCGQELLKDGSNKAISNYDIVYVFSDNLAMKDQSKFFKIKKAPEDSDALDNKILLCLNCANLYLENQTSADYQSLVNTKRHIIIESHLSKDLNQLRLEDDLTKVSKD